MFSSLTTDGVDDQAAFGEAMMAGAYTRSLFSST